MVMEVDKRPQIGGGWLQVGEMIGLGAGGFLLIFFGSGLVEWGIDNEVGLQRLFLLSGFTSLILAGVVFNTARKM